MLRYQRMCPGELLHLDSKFCHLARPVMSTAACLHHDRRRNLFSHEPAKLLPRQLPPELCLSVHGSSVYLKNTIGQIDPDHRHFGHARLPLHPLALTRQSSNRTRRVGKAATTPSIQLATTNTRQHAAVKQNGDGRGLNTHSWMSYCLAKLSSRRTFTGQYKFHSEQITIPILFGRNLR